MNATSTILDLLDDPATIESDGKAVEDFAFRGVPLDPAVRTRVETRVVRMREESFARHGYINTEDLRPSPIDGE